MLNTINPVHSTSDRLKAIEQLLQWEIIFKIHYPNSSFTEYYIETFEPKRCNYFGDPEVLVTFPFRSNLSGGGSGGSYTRLPKASKQILKLIRDYHDVHISNIWEHMYTFPESQRKGQIVELLYPETQRLMELKSSLWGGTIFVETDQDLTELNHKLRDEQQRARQVQQSLLSTIKSNIELYRQSRKDYGQWDSDVDLSLDPVVDAERKVCCTA